MAIVPLRGFHKSTTNKMTHILMAKRLTLCLNVKYVKHISEIHIYDLTYLWISNRGQRALKYVEKFDAIKFLSITQKNKMN